MKNYSHSAMAEGNWTKRCNQANALIRNDEEAFEITAALQMGKGLFGSPVKTRKAVKEKEEKMEHKKTMDYEGKLPFSTRFFKVLIPGFQKELRLPPVICAMLNGDIPEAAILISCRGSWRVSIGQCSKGLTFYGQGWASFIWYHDLNVGDFVVFEHTGHMHFNTLVFDRTTCEKEFPMTLENVKDKGSADDIHELVEGIKREPEEATPSYQYQNGHFRMTLHQYNVKHHPPFLYIPAAFLKSNDLSEKTAVTLINPSGDAWQVELRIHKEVGRKYPRMAMTTGWDKFVKANKLKVGDICVFKLNHSLERTTNAVMDVQVCSM